MTIATHDIQQKELSSKFKGFDRSEVKSFLRQVQEDMEELAKENARLREEAGTLEKQLMDFETLDKSLKDTLANALRMMDECRNEAKKDADLMIKKARSQADTIITEAESKLNEIQQDVDELRKIRIHFKEEMNKIISSNLSQLGHN
jgi:cell division initiation protein